jgi:hypothetical protein
MTRQSLVSCSPTGWATVLTGIAEIRLMISASNNRGKAAIRPYPGHAERLDPAAGAMHARHTGMQKRLVLRGGHAQLRSRIGWPQAIAKRRAASCVLGMSSSLGVKVPCAT